MPYRYTFFKTYHFKVWSHEKFKYEDSTAQLKQCSFLQNSMETKPKYKNKERVIETT